jgi:hypothetical protein
VVNATRFLAAWLVVGGMVLAGKALAAQTPAAAPVEKRTASAAANPNAARPKKADAKPFVSKRTPDGQPDLQGYWQWAGMSTGKEKRHLDVGLDAPDGSGLWAYGQDWRNDQQREIQNNLPKGVIDPADGWLPMQPWADQAKYDIVDSAAFPRSLADVDPHGRCLPSGVPRTNYAIRYVGYQFLQAPGYVVLYTELNHQPRIIPLDDRPHLGGKIRLFLGDSRGKWQGNTLTITTKNQRVPRATGFGWLDMNATLYSDAIDVVEKYSIVNEDIIAYETTVSDPKVMTRPWKMAGTFIRAVKDWEVLEFACHEGNHAIDNIRESIELRAKEKAHQR